MEARVRSPLPSLDPHVVTVLRNVIPKPKGWRRTINIDMRPRRTQRIIDEYKNHLANQDVEQFHSSKHVLQVKAIFDEMTEDKVMTEREMCDVRDYI